MHAPIIIIYYRNNQKKKKMNKGVFINTLVGGGWAIENFCRQTFLTPPSQAAKTFWTPPQESVKTFLTPPPLLHV